jgi:hypothetical protein
MSTYFEITVTSKPSANIQRLHAKFYKNIFNSFTIFAILNKHTMLNKILNLLLRDFL